MLTRLYGKYKSFSPGMRAAIWYTFCNMAQKGISLLVVPIYTRMLSTEEYGIYSVFLSWWEIFEIIATLRLFYGAYIVGLVKFEGDKKRYTSSLEALSIVITTVCMSMYLIFYRQVNAVTGLNLELTLLLFGILYATPVIGFWNARQRVENHYILMVIVALCIAVLTPLLGILSILWWRAAALSIIAARAFVEIGVAFLLFLFCRKYFCAKCNFFYWKYALRTNIPLVPYYLSTVVLNHSDRIVIQQIVGSAEAGIYSVAYSAAMVMQLFSSALNSSLQPWLYKKLNKNNLSGVAETVSLSILVVAAVNFFLILLAPEVVALLAPPQYHEAIWIIPPVTASVVVMYIYQQFVNVEFYYEESKLIAMASIGAAILNLGLNFILIPYFGYLAAGYTTLASYLIFAIVHYLFMVRICKLHQQSLKIYDVKLMVIVLLGFLVATAFALATYKYLIIRYLALFLSAMVVLWRRKKIVFLLQNLLRQKNKE